MQKNNKTPKKTTRVQLFLKTAFSESWRLYHEIHKLWRNCYRTDTFLSSNKQRQSAEGCNGL